MREAAYVFRAAVLRIIDGDTVELNVDLGFKITHRVTCRLWGINTRERGQPGAKEATDHLAGFIPPGIAVTFRSLGVDKYGGRVDGVIITADGVNVAEWMITTGYAAVWDGHGIAPVPPWPILVSV